VSPPAPPAGPAGGAARRAWHAPLALHALLLLVLLAVGLAITAPHVAYMSDEAAALVQARQLESGAGWYYRYPLSSLDPEDAARPFVRADAGTKGVAPYAKHPLYPVLLAASIRLGGEGAIWVLALTATVAAALVAAALTRLMDPRLDRAAFWLVGLGSPLFFDTYLVLGHGLAAAVGGAAVLAGVVAVAPGASTRRRVILLVLTAVGLAAAAMVRTEAVFLGPALALAAAVLVGARRLGGGRAAVLAAVAVLGSAGGWLIDHQLARAIVGRAYPGVPNVEPSSWLQGRYDAFFNTWLTPSYAGSPTSDRLVLLGLLLLVAAAVLIRRGERRRAVIGGLMVAAAACYVARGLVGTPGAIPGLVVAFPVGWFLLCLAGRQVLQGIVGPILALTAATSTAVVLLTEYSIGGGVEWGGRYFAFILPIAVPALVVGAAGRIRAQDREVRNLIVGSLVALTLVVSGLALQSIRHTHQLTAGLLDDIRAQAAIAGDSGGLDRPVVLSTNRLLPQIDSRDFDDFLWVVPDAVDLQRYGDRLAGMGVQRAVLFSEDVAADLARLPGWQAVPGPDGETGPVVVIERT
jgi:hypothetical protein